MQTPYSRPTDDDLLERTIKDRVATATPPKAVAIFGPRRIGKTTLLEQITQGQQTSWYVGEFPGTAEALSFRMPGDVVNLLTAAPNLVIDEAHKIADIGTIIKMLVDTNERLDKPCRIFLTSSSAIHQQTVKETAVGRIASRQMWPFSLYEMAAKFSWGFVNSFVERFLIYGLMPISALKPHETRDFLDDYCAGHLLKDFYDLYPEKNPRLVSKILVRLAHYIGSEISYESLAWEIGTSRNTLEDYISKLEECSIIRICPSYSRNLANELKKGKKIYIFDNGVRNALIHDFSPMSSRADAGALWENFFFMERIKLHDTIRDFKSMYFWRTTGPYPKEIDFLEVLDGSIEAFECKLSPKIQTSRHDMFFKEKYPGSKITVVRPADCMRIFKEAYRTSNNVDESLNTYLQALKSAAK